ncbi:MAG: phosphoribosylglycinamide formyltransferase, partial [Limnohabitans sp.]
MKNLVILISGSGSNMQAIARAAVQARWEQTLNARIAAVISNRPDAKGLQLVAAMGLTTQVVDHTAFADRADPRTAFDDVLRQTIDAYEPSLVILAGFMRILTPGFVVHYEGRLLNIHPSLLPAFPGLHTHQRAIE